MFLTAGLAAMSLQALRQSRNALLPLWADSIGLSVQTTAVLFGLSLGVELLLVYPGGSVMDRWGRKAAAIPCLVIMSIGLALLPLTDGAGTLALVALLLGAGNGLSSGVVMTLGADFAPPAARVPFLGVWRVLSDTGTAGGPLIVAGATAAITLGGAAVTVGVLGLLAAAFVARYVPETGVRGGGVPAAPEAGPVTAPPFRRRVRWAEQRSVVGPTPTSFPRCAVQTPTRPMPMLTGLVRVARP